MARPTANDDTTGRRVRVVLGATCYADAEGALTIAAELARQVGAELHGLLVQDEAILTAAGRPRALVVSYSGGQATGVTADAMLRAFQADARRFESELTGLAKTAAIAAEFRATGGRLAEVVLQSAGSGDVAIFGFRRAMRDSGSVVLILGGQGEPPEFAAPLAQGLRKRLIVLTGAPRRKEIAKYFARRPGPAPELRVCDDPDALLRRLETLSPAAVIVAADRAELPAPARLVNAARCPVILATAQTA